MPCSVAQPLRLVDDRRIVRRDARIVPRSISSRMHFT